MSSPQLPVVVEGAPPLTPKPLDTPQRVRRETLRLILRSPTFIVGAIVTLSWVACAVVGLQIAPYHPIDESFGFSYESPSWNHPFGLDRVGRDIFSRVIVGARSVIEVAPAASLLGVTLGSFLGLIMGYFSGWTDNIIGRILDAILAVPFIVFGILLLTALSGTSEGISISSLKLVIVIGLAFMPIVARTVRSAVLVERDLDYVQAAKLRGERSPYIMFFEILPNVMGPIVVEATVRLGYAVFAVATLAFLGYGPQPPSPDWGLQIAEQYSDISLAWWAIVFPALAIASLVVAINLIADTVQQVLDQ
ncbi:MAG: ABC transporter permease [Actinomycetota bacterium]|nr:ABC transporter permease [Actinomycetota bacterium]